MAYQAPAVGFAVQIIQAMSEQTTAVGISEISRLTGINKNMISRVLQTLEATGWVSRDIRAAYTLTLLPFCITSKATHRYSVASIGIPVLQEFWQECGESTYLAILRNDEALYLAHFDSVSNVRVAGAVGGSYPLYCTGPGKALLAFADEAYIEQYLNEKELTAYTPNTITDKEALRAELAAIRERGYALDNEEFGCGIVCMAAPVFDQTKTAVGVVGFSLSTVYGSVDDLYGRYGEQLLATARKISRNLGYIE